MKKNYKIEICVFKKPEITDQEALLLKDILNKKEEALEIFDVKIKRCYTFHVKGDNLEKKENTFFQIIDNLLINKIVDSYEIKIVDQ